MSDEELIAEIQRFERGEAPSPFGELQLVLSRGPVSQQARRSRKQQLANDIKDALAKYQFLLTGDVELQLEWLVHERIRYESDEGADVDNILKPTLDALAGPKGILVDDCQVQAVTSTWIDWKSEEQQLTLRLRHEPDAFMPKSTLAFVELGRNLWMPVNTAHPAEARRLIANVLRKSMDGREKLEKAGASYESARVGMPIQRLFHRSRLSPGFRLGTLDDYCSGALLP